MLKHRLKINTYIPSAYENNRKQKFIFSVDKMSNYSNQHVKFMNQKCGKGP